MNDRDFIATCLGVATASIILMFTGDMFGAVILSGFFSMVAFGRWGLNR